MQLPWMPVHMQQVRCAMHATNVSLVGCQKAVDYCCNPFLLLHPVASDAMF